MLNITDIFCAVCIKVKVSTSPSMVGQYLQFMLHNACHIMLYGKVCTKLRHFTHEKCNLFEKKKKKNATDSRPLKSCMLQKNFSSVNNLQVQQKNPKYHEYNSLTVYWMWCSTEFPCFTLKFQYSLCYVIFSKQSGYFTQLDLVDK